MTEVFDQAVDSVVTMMEVMLMVDRYYVYIYYIYYIYIIYIYIYYMIVP